MTTIRFTEKAKACLLECGTHTHCHDWYTFSMNHIKIGDQVKDVCPVCLNIARQINHAEIKSRRTS